MIFTPHAYQEYAIKHIVEHKEAALLLAMGTGKTVITLTAIQQLMQASQEVHKALIIAPLRVARDTWPAEIGKWDHLKDLSYSVVIGTVQERKEALRQPAVIYLINRENVQWLMEESGMPFDYAMLDFMNNPLPVEDWAVFNPGQARVDFKDIPGEEAWERLQKEQTQILAELFLGWLDGKGDRDFKAYRREAMRRCPGLSLLFDRPFSAVYKVAEGDLILRFKNTDEGVMISRDILHFMK